MKQYRMTPFLMATDTAKAKCLKESGKDVFMTMTAI